jgi:hypothetical protein
MAGSLEGHSGFGGPAGKCVDRRHHEDAMFKGLPQNHQKKTIPIPTFSKHPASTLYHSENLASNSIIDMRNIRIVPPFLFLLLAIVATSCKDRVVSIYEANVPVYETMATFRSHTPVIEAGQPLRHPGKIYIYNDLLLVNDLMTGVHIYNNSNPASPVDLGFLPIHATSELAVRNNVLYVDSYTDLLSFDISDPVHPTYLNRINDVFEFLNHGLLPGYNDAYPAAQLDPSKGVVMSWNVEKTTEESTDIYYSWNNGGPMIDLASNGGNGGVQSLSGAGIGGSTAKFTIYDNYLYTLESWQLGVFDLTEGINHISDVSLSRSAETLFPYGDNLFIGTTTGMLIYSLSNPSNPTWIADYSHVTSCDPVVVQGDKAFVTLSTGTRCVQATNALQVVDLTTLSAPYLMYEYPMTNPKGLGVDGETLFICDGDAGLKVFDKTDLSTINLHMISNFTGITAADLIPHNGVLIMTSTSGIYQYDYSDLQNITQLSLIPIVR